MKSLPLQKTMSKESYLENLESLIASKEAVLENMEKMIAEKTRQLNEASTAMSTAFSGLNDANRIQRELAEKEVREVQRNAEREKATLEFSLEDLKALELDLKKRELVLSSRFFELEEKEGKNLELQRELEGKQSQIASMEKIMNEDGERVRINALKQFKDLQVAENLKAVLEKRVAEQVTFENERRRILDESKERLQNSLALAEKERKGYIQSLREIHLEKKKISEQWSQLLSAKQYLNERCKSCEYCRRKK